jgi:hypothetical protein
VQARLVEKIKIVLRNGSAYYWTSYELDTVKGEVYINDSVNIIRMSYPTVNSHANAVALAASLKYFFL